MATNILLNKTATASDYVLPFAPGRAVDGNDATPTSRWLCKSTSAWLTVDAGAATWVNRWVVKHMGGAGWTAQYNMPNYTLQASLDNVKWSTIDSVAGNTANVTDKTFTTISARYFRISIPSGPTLNPQLASIVGFEVYDAPAPNTLSALTISSGTLTPIFNSGVLAYTASVDYNTSSITVTPTATSANATITVNGVAVTSGQPSGAISLKVGSNTITIAVTLSGVTQNYTITVTRADSVYLSNLTAQSRSGAITLIPTFIKTTQSYNASVANNISNVTFTPTAENSTATIKINGTVTVVSGQTSSSFTLNEGNNTFTIAVTSSGTTFTYTVVIARAYNLLLNKIDIAYIYRGGSGSTSVTTDATNLNYSVNLPNSPSTMTIAPFAASSNVVVKVNGVVVTSATPSASITVTSGMVVTITISTPDNTQTRSYNLTVTK